MALKAVLQTLDGVPEALRTEYKERDGKFYLDIDGIDDHDGVGALRRAKDYEKDEARKAKERARDLQAEIDKLNDQLIEMRKNGMPKTDVEALEQSYKDKLAKKEGELTKRIDALTGQLSGLMVDGEAMKLANEIAAKPEYVDLLLPHIRGRIALESSEDGTHITRVLDKDGKPSSLNLADLKKELQGNKAFAPILAGSKANGGGSNGGGGGGAPSGKKMKDMTEHERVTLFRENPEEFRKLKSEMDAEAR